MTTERRRSDDEKALLLLAEIETALRCGTKHYRLSDHRELDTVADIVDALLEDGGVILEFAPLPTGTKES